MSWLENLRWICLEVIPSPEWVQAAMWMSLSYRGMIQMVESKVSCSLTPQRHRVFQSRLQIKQFKGILFLKVKNMRSLPAVRIPSITSNSHAHRGDSYALYYSQCTLHSLIVYIIFQLVCNKMTQGLSGYSRRYRPSNSLHGC